MKTLQRPVACRVLLEQGSIKAVHFRERAWVVRGTLESYTLCDPWRTLPELSGEKRIYFLLHTIFGEVLLFERTKGVGVGWFVAGWWD